MLPLGDMFVPWLTILTAWVTKVGIITVSDEWASPLNTVLLIFLTWYTARLHGKVRHRSERRKAKRRDNPGRRESDKS